MEYVNQFRKALEGAFGPLEWLPTPDGMIHRFRAPSDKPGSLSAWYLLSVDGREGCFGSLSAGGTFTAVAEQSLAGA